MAASFQILSNYHSRVTLSFGVTESTAITRPKRSMQAGVITEYAPTSESVSPGFKSCPVAPPFSLKFLGYPQYLKLGKQCFLAHRFRILWCTDSVVQKNIIFTCTVHSYLFVESNCTYACLCEQQLLFFFIAVGNLYI